jgi:tetratricopeptide (TPR) repeat protein
MTTATRTPTDLPTGEELNRRGITLHARGDFAGAEADFRLATELDPDYPVAWNNLGLVAQTRGDYATAAAAYDGALAARPDYPEALLNRGWCRHLLGRPADAVADCDRALATAGPDLAPAVWHNRGTILHRAGDPAAAGADFSRALDLDPGRADTLMNRAAARRDAGDLAGARADLDAAVDRLGPARAAAALHLRGGVRALTDDFRGAVADYDAALAAEPDNVCYHVSRGNARYHLRDPRGAADYRAAFRLDPAAAARELARLLVEDARRRPADVLDNCDRHVRIDPADALAYARRGLTLLALGRAAEAGPDLARCGELLPGQAGDLRAVVAAVRRAVAAGVRTPAA